MKKVFFIPIALIFSLFIFPSQNAFSQTPDQWPPEYFGSWKLTNSDGEQRYIVLNENKTAATTFDGKTGGDWLYHPDESEVRMEWDNDWSDVMIKQGDAYKVYGYAPGTDPGAKPSDEYTAEKITLNPFDYLGVWQVGDGKGKQFKIHLNPDGTSKSDFDGGEEGKWTVSGNKILVEWTDGWKDVIYDTGNYNYQKQGYASGTSLDGKPSNTTDAKRLKAFIRPGVLADVYN